MFCKSFSINALILLILQILYFNTSVGQFDKGLFTDIWGNLTAVGKAPSCPGECVHAITSIFCDNVLEEITCGAPYLRCCVPNEFSYGTPVETSAPLPEDNENLPFNESFNANNNNPLITEGTTTTSTTPKPTVTHSITSHTLIIRPPESKPQPLPTFVVNSGTINAFDRVPQTMSSMPPTMSSTPSGLALSSAPSTTATVTHFPEKNFTFSPDIVEHYSLTQPCPGRCIPMKHVRFCGNILSNGKCPVESDQCCLQTEADTFDKSKSQHESFNHENSPPTDLNQTLTNEMSKISPVISPIITTTPVPSTPMPLCEGTCVVPIFSLLCDETDYDRYCPNGGTCCTSRPSATTTPPPISPCPGTCIPTILSGVCNRPSELILKTTDCTSGTICCNTPGGSGNDGDENIKDDHSGESYPSIHETHEELPSVHSPIQSPPISTVIFPSNRPLPSLFYPPDSPIQSHRPMNQPYAPMGQPQVPMGQPQVPMGQPQVQMGQPQVPMGQPQVSMGQPQVPMGQPQVQMGQPQASMGQPQLPMGQPQDPMGQPQILMNKPQQSIGQPQSSILKPQITSGPDMSGPVTTKDDIPNVSILHTPGGPPFCTGPCIAPMFRFTCFGGNALYPKFQCAKTGQICCAPMSDIQSFEANVLANNGVWRPPPQHGINNSSVPIDAPVKPPPKRVNPYTCGVKGNHRKESPRVVGGSESFPGEWCWQVALINSQNQYLCGGALIGSQWILTAAHCITNLVRNGDAIYVRVGDYDLTSQIGSRAAQTQKVSTTYIHHNHNGQTLDNDIALLKLQSPVELNEAVCIVCLPARGSKRKSGKRCVVTGYGYKDEVGPIALKIREASVPIVDDQECTVKINAVTEKLFILPASSFCAGGEEGNDACQGDGGGPLTCEVDGYYELTGLVSWGFGCGREDVPGVYVKVSSFIGWINQIISVNNQ